MAAVSGCGGKQEPGTGEAVPGSGSQQEGQAQAGASGESEAQNGEAAAGSIRQEPEYTFTNLNKFQAAALDGSEFTQDDFADRDVTVINFWALTCGPCIAEMPDLAAFAGALPDNVQVITVCLDCPVLKEDGTETGLYYQAGEFCPEESKKEICLPDFKREQLGSVAAGDAQWDFFNAFGYGTCTVHTEAPSTEPFNPFDPTDPNYPGTITDPNNPFIPVLPSNPGGYPVDPPVSPGNSTNPTDPPDPQDPLPPSDNMAG